MIERINMREKDQEKTIENDAKHVREREKKENERDKTNKPRQTNTDSDGFVNAVCHFPRYPPLQPKRIIIKT